MTKTEKTRLQFLIALLVVLAITLVVGYRLSQPAAAFETVAAEKKTAALSPQSNARIRLDLLGPADTADNIGKNNLFQFRTHPAPELPKEAMRSVLPPPPPVNPSRLVPVPPAGPVSIALKYYGFVKVGPSGKLLTAVLEDSSQHFFRAVEGDFIMGRYRVVRVTETSAEIEDTETNHRQTLALEKQ